MSLLFESGDVVNSNLPTLAAPRPLGSDESAVSELASVQVDARGNVTHGSRAAPGRKEPVDSESLRNPDRQKSAKSGQLSYHGNLPLNTRCCRSLKRESKGRSWHRNMSLSARSGHWGSPKTVVLNDR